MQPWYDRLVSGYKGFRAGDYKSQKALYEELGTHGQNPDIMLIACADSRVDPTDIFNAYPGEMFVMRNVANIVPPLDRGEGYHGTSAGIEYAVNVLDVDVIVVMGHESCGGIQGCLDGLGDSEEGGYVGKWVSLLDEARDVVVAKNTDPDKLSYEMEHEGVRQSMRNLMTFPFVKQAVEEGRLKLQGAYFSVISAKLMLSDDDGEFQEIASA